MSALPVALLGLLLASPAAVAASTPAPVTIAQEAGLAASQVTATDVCPPAAPGYARCAAQVLVLRSDHALVRPRASVVARPDTAGTPPQPGTPAFLQQAYDLTYLSQTQGGSDTVAIVDAYDDPGAESDLAMFRDTYGLPPCTSADGCLEKVNQQGQSSPLPAANATWQPEESLDLDAVSSLCPNCHILLVEAGSDSGSDLDSAVETAISKGADQISDSWGVVSNSPEPLDVGTATVLAATGDSGYAGTGTDIYPAALPGVTAVGGTSLLTSDDPSNVRGFTETAWSLVGGNGTGSGCDLQEPKPRYQKDTGCTGRAYADVSADADPATGLMIYDSQDGGWFVTGGTSLATPLVAAFEAVTGIDGAGPAWAYQDSALLNDPTTGSSGTCAPAILYICNAGPGYDGPTGNGSISGDLAVGAPGIGGPSTGDGYAESVSGSTATLTGGVYPNGLTTTAYWQYGTSTAYGSDTAPVDLGAGPLPAAAPATLTGLSPATTYHYRLVATNSDGTTDGYDYSVTTNSAGATAPGSVTPTQPGSALPANSVAPSVGGSRRQGDTLTVSPGSWSPLGTSFAYRWQRSRDHAATWATIPTATGSGYTLAAADVGAEIRVAVIATDSAGSTTVTSRPTGSVAASGSSPAARGSSSHPSVTARRLGRGHVRISARAKPRATVLLVRVGRRIYRTHSASMLISGVPAGGLWVALQTPGERAPRWMRVRVS